MISSYVANCLHVLFFDCWRKQSGAWVLWHFQRVPLFQEQWRSSWCHCLAPQSGWGYQYDTSVLEGLAGGQDPGLLEQAAFSMWLKKKRAKRPVHQICPSIFGEDTFYILYEVKVPCFWLQNSDWHINQIIKVRERRTAKETAAALLLLDPFRI